MQRQAIVRAEGVSIGTAAVGADAVLVSDAAVQLHEVDRSDRTSPRYAALAVSNIYTRKKHFHLSNAPVA